MLKPKPNKSREKNLIVWVLADDRAGNVNQALGVAEAMGVPFQVKNIAYNRLATLPNWIRGKSLMGITLESRKQLAAPWPDVIIAAGRKLVPIARAIKKKTKGKAVLAHMMNPGFPSYDIDLIAIPQHDNTPVGKNSLLTKGAPNRVSEAMLQEQKKKWEAVFDSFPSPRIALLVGGDNKYAKFTPDHAATLVKRVNHLAKSCEGSVLVSTSRRTSEAATQVIKESIHTPHYFYDVTSGEENPYLGFLATADVLVVSGDSVSMCSEACSTGKQVYIFNPEGMLSPKHKRFVKQLIAEGFAHDLSKNSQFFDVSYKPLHEAKRIADSIWNILDSA